jgi:hypothetical protein
MMVVVALLAVIILGLVAMFDQVRKAFTGSVAQVDVLEGGRMGVDLINREVAEMAPYHGSSNVPNFYVTLDNRPPLIQPLLDPTGKDKRTNVLQTVYFLKEFNRQWTGVGFRVDSPELRQSIPIPIGTLYTTNIQLTRLNLSATNGLFYFTNSFATMSFTSNLNRVVDGVVHFRVLAYDLNGRLLATNQNNNVEFDPAFNTQWDYPIFGTDSYYYNFNDDAVPAFLELEFAVLEDRALKRLRALTNNPTAATNFLSSHANQVHLFRQRIAIRNVDTQAYK